MKAIEAARHGIPAKTCSCVEVEDVGEPGPGQVVMEVQAAAINPADLLMIRGKYPGVADFPSRLGIEGAGRVIAVGDGVTGLAVGDRVMSLARTNWAEWVLLEEAQAVPVTADISMQQMAQMKANPPSALMMLRDYVDLGEGDWVIQNAANSAVGLHLIRLARKRGFRTVNVVRRDSLIQPLTEHDADVVLVDGGELAERVADATGGADIRLAIDAVGGTATQRLADCTADGGTVVNYGFLSGEPCLFTPDHLILHQLTLTGFWLAPVFGTMSRQDLLNLYGEIAGLFADGTLSVPVEATYTLDQATEALAHASRESRDGKILFTPAGPVT